MTELLGGEGEKDHSKVTFRITNFSEKKNYIRPDFYRVRPVPGEPVTLRMRLTLYGHTPEAS